VEKISQIRVELRRQKLDGYLVPLSDEFQSEYVPDHLNRLSWLTGFTGSNGFAVVLEKKAAFFTDGRYTLQSKKEVNSKIFEIHNLSQKNQFQWLKENCKKGAKIGFDSALVSKESFKKYTAINDINFIFTENIIDKIWTAKPEEKIKPAFIHDVKFAGKKYKEKISQLTKNLDADYLFLHLPESICWLLNIRGYDLPNTPFLNCFALVSKSGKVTLFCNKRKIDSHLKKYFAKEIIVKELSEIGAEFKKLSNKKVQISTNAALKFFDMLTAVKAKIFEVAEPVIPLKAIKNKTEISSLKASHKRDGKTLAEFISWIKKNYKSQTEISATEKLYEFRKKNKNFHSLSFDTIFGFGSNGAIIHYRADEKSNKKLSDGIYLLDSGAQYLDGTTDVTRTILLGKKATAEQKRNYTLVLKGHIAVATAKFPVGTTGAALDAMARQYLWQYGLDYAHGTGHGVGFFLNVHEGPQSISSRSNVALQAGMVVSNEPGYYKEGEYGIRIENLVLVKASKTKGFLEFEDLTKAPYELDLIDNSLLTKAEIEYIKAYNKSL
jgi:Xaa-Pro aminopeptidase